MYRCIIQCPTIYFFFAMPNKRISWWCSGCATWSFSSLFTSYLFFYSRIFSYVLPSRNIRFFQLSALKDFFVSVEHKSLCVRYSGNNNIFALNFFIIILYCGWAIYYLTNGCPFTAQKLINLFLKHGQLNITQLRILQPLQLNHALCNSNPYLYFLCFSS